MNGHHQGGGVALSLQPQQLSFPGGQDIKDPSLTAAATAAASGCHSSEPDMNDRSGQSIQL